MQVGCITTLHATNMQLLDSHDLDQAYIPYHAVMVTPIKTCILVTVITLSGIRWYHPFSIGCRQCYNSYISRYLGNTLYKRDMSRLEEMIPGIIKE